MAHVSVIRPLLSVTFAVALSALGTAQNFIVGGPGHSVLKGSGDSDLISDPSGGDSDILYDFDRPNEYGDGIADTLNARDGDSNDRMVGGPEDAFIGDADDWVEIRQHGTLRWQGTLRQYLRIKRMISWLITEAKGSRFILNPEAMTLSGWRSAVQRGSDLLGLVQPTEAVVDLAAYFPSSPREAAPAQGDRFVSPLDFYYWMPDAIGESEEEASDDADEELTPTHLVSLEEFELARADVQMLLAAVIDHIDAQQ